jgi:hypothetical protein
VRRGVLDGEATAEGEGDRERGGGGPASALDLAVSGGRVVGVLWPEPLEVGRGGSPAIVLFYVRLRLHFLVHVTSGEYTRSSHLPVFRIG